MTTFGNRLSDPTRAPQSGVRRVTASGITGESILMIAEKTIPFVRCTREVVLCIAYVPALPLTTPLETYK